MEEHNDSIYETRRSHHRCCVRHAVPDACFMDEVQHVSNFVLWHLPLPQLCTIQTETQCAIRLNNVKMDEMRSAPFAGFFAQWDCRANGIGVIYCHTNSWIWFFAIEPVFWARLQIEARSCVSRRSFSAAYFDCLRRSGLRR